MAGTMFSARTVPAVREVTRARVRGPADAGETRGHRTPFPSDVLAGFAAGFGWLGLTSLTHTLLESERDRRPRIRGNDESASTT